MTGNLAERLRRRRRRFRRRDVADVASTGQMDVTTHAAGDLGIRIIAGRKPSPVGSRRQRDVSVNETKG